MQCLSDDNAITKNITKCEYILSPIDSIYNSSEVPPTINLNSSVIARVQNPFFFIGGTGLLPSKESYQKASILGGRLVRKGETVPKLTYIYFTGQLRI